MENEVLDSLEQLGYSGPLLQDKALLQAAEAGLSSPQLVELCVWLGSRLKELCELEESITSGPDDVESLRVELSGLLKELHCPFQSLVSGILSGRLLRPKDHLQCVLFLCSELQAAQIVSSRKASEKRLSGGPENEELKNICHTLQLSQPSGETEELFSLIHMCTCLLTACDMCQAKLQQINTVLSSEYECRRRMLIKRLDVTIQSFGWSDRAKVKVDIMAGVYQPRRHSLTVSSCVDMSALLAAREDLCNVMKTSSGATREKTCCAVNKVLMGRVPDRGGRPSEIQAPPPEMPPWQKRQDGGGGGWGGRGGGWRGGGGGRGGGRGGWNQGHGGHGGHGRHGSHGGKRGRYQY
uniref:Family with sequence similarity 98 member B n=1 Tax=Neogobius melanostomus TaxID=47308 RepID=A0A8C6SAM1_9GOBI